jgi:hypothetical protein
MYTKKKKKEKLGLALLHETLDFCRKTQEEGLEEGVH